MHDEVRRARHVARPLARIGQSLAACLAREFDDRRAFLFAPIAFGAGAALYFGAEQEPALYVGLVPALFFALLAIAARSRTVLFYILVLLAMVGAGFTVAALQVRAMTHPVLDDRLFGVEVEGFISDSERRPRGSRIVIDVKRFGHETAAPPEKVRVTLAAREPPPVASFVRVRATLAPPPGPAYPGGFDFGRSAWFDGIGASGYAVSRAEIIPGPPPPLSLAFAAWLDESREAIAARIRASLPGTEGAIAVALVTGLRDAVPESVEESMRISGLTHILSISGLHMALVATTVFFLVRALLALSPQLALRYPIKAWAAVPALLAATYYLLLSGAEVATQRSYVMTFLVLVGVIVGRPALTLRTLTLAALVVLTITPWAIFEPGAQMSFAATLALVAAYEKWGDRLSFAPQTKTARRWIAMPVRYLAALTLTSLAAGLATAPYAAFHFQRLAPLSLLANLAAMPVVSLIIMPAGLIGSLLMPFGLDAPAWHVMGFGLHLMIGISDFVVAMPGADRGLAAMPMASLILLTFALLAFCLLATRLVWVTPGLAMLAVWFFITAPRPDVYVDAQIRTVAVRGPDGRLALMGDTSNRLENRFSAEQWMAAEGGVGWQADDAEPLTRRTRETSAGNKVTDGSNSERQVSSLSADPGLTDDGPSSGDLNAMRNLRDGPSSAERPTAAAGDIQQQDIAAQDPGTSRADVGHDEAMASDRLTAVDPDATERPVTSGPNAEKRRLQPHVTEKPVAEGEAISPSAASASTGATTDASKYVVADGSAAEGGSGEERKARRLGASCDWSGCTLPARSGVLVAYSRNVASLEEDCRRAELVITTRTPPDNCAAQVMQLNPYRQTGGVAARRLTDGKWLILPARPDDQNRPWLPKTADR